MFRELSSRFFEVSRMRIDEFKQRLAMAAPLPDRTPRAPEDEVFVSYDQLATHGIKFTRVHIRRLISRGLFPAPVLLSPNRVAWRLSDIAAWKSSRPATRASVEAAA